MPSSHQLEYFVPRECFAHIHAALFSCSSRSKASSSFERRAQTVLPTLKYGMRLVSTKMLCRATLHAKKFSNRGHAVEQVCSVLCVCHDRFPVAFLLHGLAAPLSGTAENQALQRAAVGNPLGAKKGPIHPQVLGFQEFPAITYGQMECL